MSIVPSKNPSSLQLLSCGDRDADAAPSSFERADLAYSALRSKLSGRVLSEESESKVERLLLVEGHELLRLLLGGFLEARQLDRPESVVVGDDGVERTHCRVGTDRSLATVFGDVTVPRLAWSARGTDCRHPTDATLNLPNSLYSLELQRQLCASAARMPFDAAQESMERTLARTLPKRQAEEAVVSAAVDFEEFYATHYPALPPDESADILVLSFDQKGVVLVPRDLREATRKEGELSRRKLESRLSRGEKAGRKRMATVAAVYTVKPYHRDATAVVDGLRRRGERQKRPRPEEKRVWASLERTLKEVIGTGFDEAERRDPLRTKTWYVLVDGDPDLEKAVRAEAHRRNRPVTLILDFIHALEYLWRASTAFHSVSDPNREDWVLERLTKILQGQVSTVAAGMRRSATLRKLSPESRKAVDKCVDYFLARTDMMRYDEALRAGAPIASGVIEGTCRHLINDRLEITGARWTLARAEAILKLRALLASDDFEHYWDFHEQREWWRTHAVRYRESKPPKTSPAPSKRHLRLVKQHAA